jgi:hypothetical protein
MLYRRGVRKNPDISEKAIARIFREDEMTQRRNDQEADNNHEDGGYLLTATFPLSAMQSNSHRNTFTSVPSYRGCY